MLNMIGQFGPYNTGKNIMEKETYEVRYWTGSHSNHWEVYDFRNKPTEYEAYRVAKMLAKLFAGVEVFITDAKGGLEIDWITADQKG